MPVVLGSGTIWSSLGGMCCYRLLVPSASETAYAVLGRERPDVGMLG